MFAAAPGQVGSLWPERGAVSFLRPKPAFFRPVPDWNADFRMT
jgi:hypothetical protein